MQKTRFINKKTHIILSLSVKLEWNTVIRIVFVKGFNWGWTCQQHMLQIDVDHISAVLHWGLIKFYCHRFKSQLRGRSANLANRLAMRVRQFPRLAFVAKAAFQEGEVSGGTDGFLPPTVSLASLLLCFYSTLKAFNRSLVLRFNACSDVSHTQTEQSKKTVSSVRWQ